MIENVALALITSAWHLKSYFQSHQLVEDELSHKAGLAKAWTHREDGGMVHQTFRIWPSLWTLRPHEDTIQGWLSGRIHWKQKNHPRLVEPLHRQCVQCKGKWGRNHPQRPWPCHSRASPQSQLQSLKQSGRVRDVHCKSKTSNKSRPKKLRFYTDSQLVQG